jgi:asparagine synthase (glutamine-hydrolysing)
MCGILICTCGKHGGTLTHRGPDGSTSLTVDYGIKVTMKFYHLSINSKNPYQAMQPISKYGKFLLANAEIYNHRKLRRDLDIAATTNSDCEIILDLFQKYSIDAFNYLDGEYAVIIYDPSVNKIYAARDRYGVRPLFRSGNCLASEAKGVNSVVVQPFRPGVSCIIDLNDGMSYSYFINYINGPPKSATLRTLMTDAVKKRLMGDAEIGCFLSGGLDSSIVTAIAASQIPNLKTFTIGMKGSSDVAAAKYLTEKLGISGTHTVVEFTKEEGLAALPDVIATLETYDVTTIRASVPQYLLAKYIRQNTNIRVLLSGEGSDELFAGYQYFKNAPSMEALADESNRLMNELYLFDNLRTDRTTARWGLEVRVPFLDIELTRFVIQSDVNLRTTTPIEKYWLRSEFVDILPPEIAWRSKEAFSDAVSGEVSWKQILSQHVKHLDVDETGFPSAEAAYYKSIYDMHFESDMLTHYWMPQWVTQATWDPSATTIDCYKKDAVF